MLTKWYTTWIALTRTHKALSPLSLLFLGFSFQLSLGFIVPDSTWNMSISHLPWDFAFALLLRTVFVLTWTTGFLSLHFLVICPLYMIMDLTKAFLYKSSMCYDSVHLLVPLFSLSFPHFCSHAIWMVLLIYIKSMTNKWEKIWYLFVWVWLFCLT